MLSTEHIGMAVLIGWVIGFTIGPLLTIFAFKTLFAAGLSYNFATWFSITWLQILLNVFLRIKIKKD